MMKYWLLAFAVSFISSSYAMETYGLLTKFLKLDLLFQLGE